MARPCARTIQPIPPPSVRPPTPTPAVSPAVRPQPVRVERPATCAPGRAAADADQPVVRVERPRRRRGAPGRSPSRRCWCRGRADRGRRTAPRPPGRGGGVRDRGRDLVRRRGAGPPARARRSRRRCARRRRIRRRRVAGPRRSRRSCCSCCVVVRCLLGRLAIGATYRSRRSRRRHRRRPCRFSRPGYRPGRGVARGRTTTPGVVRT